MTASTVKSFPLFLVLLCLPYKSANSVGEDLTKSITNILRFYRKHVEFLNTDAMFGLRIFQGTFGDSLSCMKRNAEKSTDDLLIQYKILVQKEKEVKRLLSIWMEKANASLKYEMEFMVSNPWRPIRTLRSVNTVKRPEGSSSSMSVEEIERINNCFRDLCTAMNKKDNSCIIEDICVDQMLLRQGLDGYDLTHQILYAVLMEQTSCLATVEYRYNVSIDRIQTQFCSKLYRSAKRFSLKDELHIKDKDLFMEMIYVCSSIGFNEFLGILPFKTFLSWQNDPGCFGDDRSSFQKRKLLWDYYIGENCQVHTTGVAAGLLGVYLYENQCFNASI